MQRKSLEDSFTTQKYLTVKQRDLLAREINLSPEQVKTWYQNRRMRWRKNELVKWKASLYKRQTGFELPCVKDIDWNGYIRNVTGPEPRRSGREPVIMYDFKRNYRTISE